MKNPGENRKLELKLEKRKTEKISSWRRYKRTRGSRQTADDLACNKGYGTLCGRSYQRSEELDLVNRQKQSLPYWVIKEREDLIRKIKEINQGRPREIAEPVRSTVRTEKLIDFP